MNGLTMTYLGLSALPAVGAHLLDARPAFLVSSDGERILWANAAAVDFFGARRMEPLLKRPFTRLNPLVAQISRLSRILPADHVRMEMLRIGRGTGLVTVPAACRRLNLTDGRAVLAVIPETVRDIRLRGRAEALVEAIAATDCLIAILDRDGRVLAASGGVDELAPFERAIDQLVARAQGSADGLASSDLAIGDGRRPAGVAKVQDEGGDHYLVLVGPMEAVAQVEQAELVPASGTVPTPEPPATPEPANDVAPPPPTVPQPTKPAEPPAPPEPPVADVPPEPETPSPVRRIRFTWSSDANGVLQSVSPVLAEHVGANGLISGYSLKEIADAFGFELPEDVPGRWSRTLAWPVEGRDQTVRVELEGMAHGDGQRGFGTIFPDDIADAPETAARSLPARDPEAEEELDEEVVSKEPDVVAPPTDAPSDDDDADSEARRAVEASGDGASLTEPLEDTGTENAAGEAEDEPDNVVHLPGSENHKPRRALSGPERDLFRRIGDTLRDQDTTQPDETDDAEATAEPPAQEKLPTDTAILDRVPIGLLVVRNGDTLFANRKLVDLLGYEGVDDLIAAGGADVVFPDQAQGWSGRNLTSAGGRLFAATKNNGSIAVEVSLHAVTWEDASALMLALRPDAGAADHDEMAEELALATGRIAELESVLDTATDGVLVVDRQGTIGNLNQAAEALFGLESGEMIGQSFTDLLAEESRKPALDYLDGLASNGVASVLNDGREVIGRVPRGGLIPLFMTMGRIGDEDSFCAVLRDITHWKNVEEELMAARSEAEAANKQKSEFLAKVSHEIRTPLNAIIGFSEVMIEERFGPVGNDRYRSYLRDIHTSGGHLMSLVNDLLDLSKIEAGKLELNFEAVTVNDVIQETVALMQPQANRERIIIRTSLASDMPQVVADERSLRQILLNLLSNAIKFTRAGGQVIVSTGLEDSGEVELRIRDTGIGMSEKDVQQALQPFRQVAPTKRENDRGTGLGLPLTKALVEANRASFAIDSALDQGTLVKVTFPTTRVLAG